MTKTGEPSRHQTRLLAVVREILRHAWDPIGVNRDGNGWTDEYDGYAPHALRMALGGSTSADVAAHLGRVTASEMGLEPRVEKDRAAAELIVRAVSTSPSSRSR